MTHRIAAALALVFAFLLPVLAHASSDCKCSDKQDLINRYREAKAAIAEYQKQAAAYGNMKYTYTHYRRGVQPHVQTAINGVTDSTANRVRGGTDAGTCERQPNKVNSGKQTKCIAKAIEVHENVHQSACVDWKTAHGPFRGADYRNGMTMAKYLGEEIAAYEAEIEFIKKQFDATCPLGWTLDFDVTLSGEGSKAIDADNHISWKVKHKYTGKVDLLLEAPTMSIADGKPPTVAEMMAGTYARMWTAAGGAKTPLDVEIDDRIEQYAKDPGEGDSYEATTTTSTWKGNGKDHAAVGAVLETDDKAALYNLKFGVLPADATKQLTVVVKEEIDRTPYGYGDAPTHESNTTRNEKDPFSVMQIPDISGIIKGAKVERTKEKLELTNDSIEFTDTFAPPASYLSGLPNVTKNLKVRVHYRLTRIELD
jgi:hypothetical protein